MASRRAIAVRTGPALVLLIAVVAGGLIWLHRHQNAEQALERDPSYKYGRAVMDKWVESSGGPGSPTQMCQSALAAHPSAGAGYSAAVALRGCTDEWTRINR